MVAPLSTVLIPIVGIPVDAAICAVVPAELSARQLDLLLGVLLFHGVKHPLLFLYVISFIKKYISVLF